MSIGSAAERVVLRVLTLALCGCAACHALAVRDDVAAPAALDEVNQALNHRIVYAEDQATWGRADHWATPDETRAQGAGDCEDYAIAKYFALRAVGVPAQQLRLVYVRVLVGGSGDLWRPHVVLAYLPAGADAGDARILDNLLDEIRPLSRRPDLQVLISFNTDGVWPGLERGRPARAADRIRPWAQMLQRMDAAH